MKFKNPTRLKLATTATCCISIVCINIAIFTSIIIGSIAERTIKNTITMTPDNQDIWGDVPGKYDINVVRNLSLFNILNPDDIIGGTNPIKVQHTDPIYIREKHIISNAIFSSDQNQVTFNQTFTFDVAMDQSEYDRIVNSNVTMINLYALAAWDTAANQLNFSQKMFHTLGQVGALVVKDDDVYYESMSLAIYVVYINASTFDQLYSKDFGPAGISRSVAAWIYNDTQYGWNSNQTMKKWAQALIRGVESDDTLFLADYFGLEYDQISKLFNGRVAKAAKECAVLIKDNFNCPPNSRMDCDPLYLTMLQLGGQYVTLSVPPPITPFESITVKNHSVTGYPEFSYYYNEYFLKYIDNSTEYQNLEITPAECLRLFLFHANGNVVNTNTTLIHPINTDRLVQSGLKFEQTGDITAFDGIRAQLLLNNNYLVRVIYEWGKYLTLNLSTSGSGDFQITTKSKWAQQAVSDNMASLLSNLKQLLQGEIAYGQAISKGLNCAQTIADTLFLQPDDPKILLFCDGSWNKNNIKTIYSFCNQPTTSNYQKSKLSYFGFTYLEMNILCDKNDDIDDSFGDLLNITEHRIADLYGCSSGFCSQQNITLMQIVNSTVTLNPPSETSLIASNTIKSWMPDIFPNPFEFKYFLDKYKLTMRPPTMLEASQAFNWDHFNSPIAIGKAIVDYHNGDTSYINEQFHFDDPSVFEKYVNFLCLDSYLGGITYTGKIGDIIFGVSPDVINKVRTTPPLFGGDPSTPEWIAMNENNTWLLQTRLTGKNDYTQAANYLSTNYNNTVNMLMPQWDGVKVTNKTFDPWASPQPYKGGDSSFKMNIKKGDKQYGYISDLYRSLGSNYSGEVKKNLGITAYRYLADIHEAYNKYDQPSNAAYYQNEYTGLFNYTSVKKAPVYLSKLMLKDTNDSVKQNIVMYNNKGDLVEFDPVFEGWLDIEPRTGAPMDLRINFQINVDSSLDSLIQSRPNLIVPAFILRREMILTDDQVYLIYLGTTNIWSDDRCIFS